MSMNFYAVKGTGLVLSDREIDGFMEHNDIDDLAFWIHDHGEEYRCMYADANDCYHQYFTNLNLEERMSEESLIFWSANQPTLFETAYDSSTQLIQEFQDRIGSLLPEDWEEQDYGAHIGSISFCEYC